MEQRNQPKQASKLSTYICRRRVKVEVGERSNEIEFEFVRVVGYLLAYKFSYWKNKHAKSYRPLKS